ncbi:MAG: site-specific integrase [Verrucomicrobiota bacterium]
MQALLNVAGKYRLLYVMAALTGIRHGEFKKLCRGDLNLNSEKPSVMVRASISKNHKQACLPLHRALLRELMRNCPANASPGDLVFGKLVPRSDLFCEHLKAAGISKKDSQGRVVDFHSFRHTFCTYLHRAGVPLREAMELMRHSDVRLTMSVYADSSLFALRPAVEKLPWNYLDDDAQIDAQSLGASGLLPSLPVTVGEGSECVKTTVNTGEKSLHGTLCHAGAESDEWCAIQGSNL